MKIIISSYDDVKNPYYGGGGAIAVHEIAKRLARNHQITIITSTYRGAQNKKVDGVFYKRIGSSKVGALLSQIVYQFLLPFQVKQNQADIWIESFTPPISCNFLPLFTAKPVVALTHFLGADHMSKKYKLPFFIIQNLGLRLYNYFISITDEQKKYIQKHNVKADVTVIPNALKVNSATNQAKYAKKHILFIGRLDIYQKGIDTLLEAYKENIKKINYPLVIAGHGSKTETVLLKKKIKQLHLEKNVFVVGKVEGERKKNLFLQSTLTVVPSRFESFGIVLLEAFYYQSPVITFDIPDLKWISDDYCIKVKPGDKETLGTAMTELCAETSKRSEMIKKASVFASQFNWDNCANQYEKVLLAIHKKEYEKN